MKMNERSVSKMLGRTGLRLLAALFGLAVVGTVSWLTGIGSQQFVTATPAVTQKFSAVPSERALLIVCFRLKNVQGVTGVSFRDYSPLQHTAIVTVFFDPALTSPRQIMIFVQHTSVLWEKPVRA